MLRENTGLLDKLLLKPSYSCDSRGWFYRQLDLREVIKMLDEDLRFVNLNRSFNNFCFTMRGMHLQRKPMEEVKIVSCLKGSVQDVIVDVNPNSKTFLNYISCILSSDNRHQLIVPRGFAHGYLTLEENTEVQYVTTEYYSPHDELVFDSLSPELQKVWLPGDYFRSEKDKIGKLII